MLAGTVNRSPLGACNNINKDRGIHFLLLFSGTICGDMDDVVGLCGMNFNEINSVHFQNI